MDVGALVTAGATTVIGLMASDAWTYTSGRLARLLGRSEQELRSSRAELLLARTDGDGPALEQFEEDWRERLRAVLETDQAAVRELTALLDEVNPGWRGAPSIVNTVSGGDFHGNSQVFMGREFTINQSPRQPDDRGNSG
ncbi:hypothetical protein OG311_16735 [Streptomyces sp. NBC_01343]|uniref:hypothetical protein n=1 Tax=Streptomyces sp. NBC_01343 TaxID=2903832 RepID=UPI002E12A658|nr:hypothetical protein OG311_16735 [Streptomyces sp. NBC_01343]